MAKSEKAQCKEAMNLVELGLTNLLEIAAFAKVIGSEHTEDTPARFTKALSEMFEGVYKKPETALATLFDAADYDQMIHIKEMAFFSVCAHHLLPFFGKASFAYIPDRTIVGLSKIPRLLEIYARRPQVQEQLSKDMVDNFQRIVQPLGCGIMIRSFHLCCASRGVRQPTSYMETTCLSGNFKDTSVKEEFLASVNATEFKVF